MNQCGLNIHVHGSSTRNLSAQLSLSQTSNNTMSFLLSLMFSLQQNQKTRGWNRFCPEKVGRNVAQTMYTHVSKCKNNKVKRKNIQNTKKFSY
jgi:hypothetical protein